MKTTIISVITAGTTYTVTYSTGAKRTYQADKLPKTVTKWMDEHQEEPEEVKEVKEEVKEVVEEVVEEVIEETARELPAATQKQELIALVKAEAVPDTSMGAAEAVAFGTCIAMAVAFWGIVGLVRILAAGIEVLAYWAWSHREQAAAGCRTAARWIGSGAASLADHLPEVTTRRGLLVAVRVLPILIGMLALM